MLLTLLLFFLLIILSLIRFSFFELLSSSTKYLHTICINQLPSKTIFYSELSALVCAEDFNNLNNSQLYISSGLIHLFVVSGAHFILIETFLQHFLSRKNKAHRLLIFTILLLYGFMCNLNPPVTRCLIGFCIGQYLFNKNLYWPTSFKLFVVGFTCLLINPKWITSLSLQLSWIAALVTNFCQIHLLNASIFLRQSLFFIALYPALCSLQAPSTSVILANIIFAPALEFILFPIGILVGLFNFLYPVFDLLISILQKLLQLLEFNYVPSAHEPGSSMHLYNWAIILFLHMGIHLFEVAQKQKTTYDHSF